MLIELDYTKQSRAGLLNRLTRELETRGGCYSVSAPANFGKSYFLKKLAASPDPSLLFIYIDLNLRAEDSPQAFYELILHEHLALPLPENSSRLQECYTLVSEANTGPFAVARAFMAGIQEVLQSTSRRLVLMLDELDKPLSLLPGQVFLHLRALVDRYPDRLSYVTGTVVPLPACGREEEEGISEFYELFEEQGIFRLPGLSYEEVRESLQYTAPVNLPEIYRLSGGHPVLTGRVISAATGSRELLPLLKTDPQLRRECRRIWESLVEEEQKALLQWLEGIKSLTATPYLGSLEERGLIRQGQSRPVIFSDLFEEYLREKLEAAAPATGFREVAYDPHRDEVIFDGGARRITLTGNAATLFNYLYLRQSKPWCSKDELISAVWGNAAYSPENLDKLVSDLRQELGDSDKTLIRTIPRKGLVLVGVRGWNTRTSE